jgi:hypothetical protein
MATLMLWSLIGAPATIGQEGSIEEPGDLAAYSTFADGMPVQLWFDHQTRQIPLGPALAHSNSEVSLPSAASSIAWLVDGGVANGLHGTTTGAKVPTEASAKQPGGSSEEEFQAAGGPIGDGDFVEVRGGRAFAEAEHSQTPRGYSTSQYASLLVLPAAGSPTDAPGTFNPDATYPGGSPNETDPAPQGQMGILAIGDIASTSESLRENSTVRSIAVSELKDINIGNRTSDNRCTNCIRIDSIRAEAFAEANGQPGGATAEYRVILGRACRRAFNAETGEEEDRCLPLDPHDPEGTHGLRTIEEVEAFNDFFAEPIWWTLTNGQVTYTLGIRIHAGERHEDPNRARRTSDPKDDADRNYAYPSSKMKDADKGQVAKAVAEGIDIEIFTITASEVTADAEQRIKGTPAEDLLAAIDEDDDQPGLQISGPDQTDQVTGQQTIPTDTITSVRRIQLTLGVARASAVARPLTDSGFGLGAGIGGSDGTGSDAAFGSEVTTGGAGTDFGAGETGDPGATPVGGIAGPLALKLDWSSFRLRPWPPYDMAKGFGVAAIVGGVWWLIKRRRLARAG